MCRLTKHDECIFFFAECLAFKSSKSGHVEERRLALSRNPAWYDECKEPSSLQQKLHFHVEIGVSTCIVTHKAISHIFYGCTGEIVPLGMLREHSRSL